MSMVLAARAFIQRIDRLLVTAYTQDHNGCICDCVLGRVLSLYKKDGSMAWLQQQQGACLAAIPSTYSLQLTNYLGLQFIFLQL